MKILHDIITWANHVQTVGRSISPLHSSPCFGAAALLQGRLCAFARELSLPCLFVVGAVDVCFNGYYRATIHLPTCYLCVTDSIFYLIFLDCQSPPLSHMLHLQPAGAGTPSINQLCIRHWTRKEDSKALFSSNALNSRRCWGCWRLIKYWREILFERQLHWWQTAAFYSHYVIHFKS